MKRWASLRERLGKDAWLLVALAAAVLACVLLGASGGGKTAATDEELRLCRVLSAIEGAGRVEAAVFREASEEAASPCGAVIVADGAGDVAVRLALTRAASALLGLDENHIEIFRLKEGTP